jgi:hypothetical protein
MKRKILLSLLIFLFFISVSPAEERRLIGGSAGWQSVKRTENIAFIEGRGGFHDIVLSERAYDFREDGTDLLMHFDQTPFGDLTGRYAVLPGHRVNLSPKAKLGGGSAKFQRIDGGLTLLPSKGSLFSETSLAHSFSIEFWLHPLHLSGGETVLQWEGQHLLGGKLHLQGIRAYIDKRKLTWDFSNIFFSSDFRPQTISLTGTERLIPRKWHHHLITFDEERGLLEYYLDGKPEALRYITDTGSEGGTVRLPYIGRSSQKHLSIGTSFDGSMDELRISREYRNEPLLSPYSYELGWMETELIDLRTFGAQLISISSERAAPPQTDIFYFYRLYDTMEESIREPSLWVPFIPGESIADGARGRYLQLRCELYPDGTGSFSPSLSSFSISYEPNLPPLPPSYIRAEAGNASVSLEWNSTLEDDMQGYLVYYGTEPGVYRGRGASAGDSPIDTGDATSLVLDGLENGRVYYFSVAAYDSAGKKNRGLLSEEVSARPYGSKAFGSEGRN